MNSKTWLVSVVALALGVSACGSSSDKTSDDADAGAATKAALVQAPPTRPPAQIQVSDPLAKKPPSGKKVIFLQCALPACERYVQGWKAASAALGWSASVQVFKPDAPSAALQQAITQHPDYIGITGIPAAALKPQLAAAEKAGIPVISCATPDKPSAGGYAAQCGGTLAGDAENLARWAINDSGGKAKVLAVTIPQYPVLNTETDWLKSKLKGMCPGCAYGQLDVGVQDLVGGSVPQKVVAYLQSHPDVKYVYFTFNDLTRGMPAALKTAGLTSKVKLIGAAGDASIMKQIGTEQSAWTIAPNVYSAWVMVDAMARLSVDDKLSPAYQDAIYTSPTWVFDSPSSAKLLSNTGFDWYGPASFEDKFKKLWQVGEQA
jgi:ABC-type sugar transport system substrate-binding protein